jgi:tetratricopeptide (TPR) repeat protein
MKAEHRHELKTNALADTMGRLLQGLKTGPSRHSLLIWGLVILAVVIALTGYFIFKTNKENKSNLWVEVDDAQRQLDDAGDLDRIKKVLDDDFKKTAEAKAGTPQARVLSFDRARTLFRLGIERLYDKHDEAVKNLKEARDLYANLAKETDGDNSAVIFYQEALMNVARADETLGDVDEALKGYEKLASRHKDSAYGKAAKERADYLKDENNRKQVRELNARLDELAKGQAPPAVKPEEKK